MGKNKKYCQNNICVNENSQVVQKHLKDIKDSVEKITKNNSIVYNFGRALGLNTFFI